MPLAIKEVHVVPSSRRFPWKRKKLTRARYTGSGSNERKLEVTHVSESVFLGCESQTARSLYVLDNHIFTVMLVGGRGVCIWCATRHDGKRNLTETRTRALANDSTTVKTF